MSTRNFPQGSTSRIKLFMGLSLAVFLSILLSGCVAQYRNHGYVPSDDELSQVVVGVDTKDTVADVVGVPGTEGVLDSSGWYYVRSQFRHMGALDPKEVDRQVVAISFDSTGTVSNIERFGLEQGRVVVLSRRVTEPNVKGITFIQQLFGNLGQISAEQLLQ